MVKVVIRTITASIHLAPAAGDYAGWEVPIAQAAAFLKAAEAELVKQGGYEVQTTRIETPPFETYLNTIGGVDAFLADVAALVEKLKNEAKVI